MATLAGACGDDSDDKETPVNDAAVTGEVGKDAGITDRLDATTPPPPPPPQDAAAPTDSGESSAPGPLQLPNALSLSGCDDLGIPALCSLKQEGGNLTANCAGALYTGTLSESRDLTLSATLPAATDGTIAKIACSGKAQANGAIGAECKRTNTPTTGAPSEETCTLFSDPKILPDVSCLELPSELTNVSICDDGAAMGGTTIAAGTCKVVQDGCVFQAECANNVVLAGTVTDTGLRFTSKLKALADAQTPTNGNPPAFLKGAEANHTCTGTLEGTTLSGSCAAGAAGRGGMNTSVCALKGAAAALPQCEQIGPSAEELVVLESCDLLKNGEDGNAGIGEPVCAVRQRGCIWDIQCGRDAKLKFSGRLQPGEKKASWKLDTGTPCSVSFDANGKLTGACTVPGQAACELSSKPAVAGGPNCPVLGSNFTSNGCGPFAMDCRKFMQHGCGFVATCDFGTAATNLVIAGESSVKDMRPRIDMKGIGDYTCEVEKATDAEVMTGDRKANEWYGDCTNSAGGTCRDNYNADAGTGFRGLRVYFE
jgi:hypothetical protein